MTNGMEAAELAKFSPFNALKSISLDELVKDVIVLQASQGEVLFSKGDTGRRSIYLLSGSISLVDDGNVVDRLDAGSEAAQSPVAPVLPRQVTAIADGDVRYFSIDSEAVDVTLTLEQTGIYEVGDIEATMNAAEGDWMSALLRTKTFQLIPPQNIQMIFMRLQRRDYKAGDVVIKQGDHGDHFFIITSGRCMVTRETPGTGKNIDLADLGVGATFGEEALISNEARNATVTMLTDGTLMQLGRDDFQSLLNDEMVVSLSHDDADEAVSQGGQWLDVRVPSEFRASSKANATNLPLYMLRHKLDALDPGTPYVVYCDTGRRSSAAAFILNQRGFETAVLKGGLNCTEL